MSIYNNQSWWIFASKLVGGKYGKHKGEVLLLKGEVQLRSHRQSYKIGPVLNQNAAARGYAIQVSLSCL